MGYKIDYYKQRAQREGRISRAYYKLSEIDKRFRVFRKKDIVLDVGCFPGGWLEYTTKKVRFVVGFDKKKTYYIRDNVKVIRGDIFDDRFIDKIKDCIKDQKEEYYSVIISDVMINTTGNKELDSYRSSLIAMRLIELLPRLLKEGGCFVFKIFQGAEFENVYNKTKKLFRFVRSFKPKSSRSKSKEMYIICKDYLR